MKLPRQCIPLLPTYHLYFWTLVPLLGCGLFVVSVDPGIDSYKTPLDCLAFYTLDETGVALDCKVDYVNNVSYFESMPSRYLQSILVTCTVPYMAPSSLENVSFSHFKELKELLLVDCKFLELPRGTFQNMRGDLQYVSVNCLHDAIHSLTIEDTSLQPLVALQMLNLSFNNLKRFPKGELCYLTQLQELILNNNSLTNMADLGFSDCRQPSTENCGSRLEIMELDFNRFTTLVDDGLSCLFRLQVLWFKGNRISEMQPRAFANLTHLVYLELSLNAISSIPSGIWTDVGSLQFLNMSRNDLSGELDGTTFAGLSRVVQLDLSFNRIEYLTADTFKNLTQLTRLNLASNKIKAIADGTFGSLAQLTTLLLDHNNISVLTNDTLVGLENLTVLMLNDNHLMTLEHLALVNSPGLVNISLDNNHLVKMPNLQGLSSLEILSLANNRIEEIPENAFRGLANLTHLCLESNAVKTISETVFVDLQNLIVLNLSFNALADIPKSLLNTTKKLRDLNLSRNQLTSIISFDDNSSLVSLDISGNRLSSLDLGIFPPSLTYLSAAQNQISSLQSKLHVVDKVRITELYLAYNKITVIQFNSLPSTLQILDLEMNIISHVDSNVFQSMTSLKRVSLVANRLDEMSQSVLSVSTSLLDRPVFELTGNPFCCTCNMLWIKSINSVVNNNGDRYGYVSDLQYLYCWLPRRRDEDGRPIKPVVDVSVSDFQCEFRRMKLPTDLCRFLTSTNKTKCDLKCPDDCLCWRTHNWRPVTVDCHNANWTAVQGGIPDMTMVLYLDDNFFVELNQNSFEDYPNLEVLYLNASNIHVLRNDTFVRMTKLRVLHLESNSLQTLTSGMFNGLGHLEELFLSSNLLDQIDENAFQPLRSLKRLELQNNRLVHYPVWALDKIQTLSLVSLSQNPWSCDCNYLQKYWDWLQRGASKVLDINHLVCYSDTDNATLPVLAFNGTVCIPEFDAAGASHWPVVIVMLVLFISLTTISVLLFVYRHEMQVLVYSRYGLRLFYNNKEVNDKSKLYDAFVCYSNMDEEFVVHQLIPNLEGIKFPYKLCLHQRDFAVGSFITESILDAVEYSRRTIVVFTEAFLKSEWCRFEFKTAHLQMLRDRCGRIILIVKDKIPADLDAEMKLYLKTNTYLRWDDKMFWQKLYFALPEKKPQT